MVVPERPFVVRLVLACREPVPVEFVDLELRGAVSQFRHGEYGQAERAVEFMRLRSRVRQSGQLDTGEHQWNVTFTLPAATPATYSGELFRVTYSYRVHVSVPWWPDARAEYVALVEDAPPASPSPPTNRVFTSGFTRGTSPYFELSLGTDVVAPGESLLGAIALANTQTLVYGDATLSLIVLEQVKGFLRGNQRRRQVCRWILPAAHLRQDEPLDFSLRVPDSAIAGFEQDDISLSWFLHAEVDVPWARDPEVWIPLTIVGRRDRALAGEHVPPVVGTRRVEALWRDVAARCGLTSEPGAMHGTIGDSELRIAREHRDGRGAVAVARLSTPDLGLGLALAAGPPWLVGRDVSQSTWLKEHVFEHLRARPPSAAGDHGLTFEVEDRSQDAAPLVRFVEEVKAVAIALEAARPGIPAPAAMAALVPAWERAAAHFEGRLQRADMTIAGRLDGLALTLRTDWDSHGRPRRTTVEVRPGVPIDRRHHLAWRAEDGPPPATELPLAPLWADAVAVEVDSEAVRVSLAAPLEDPLTRLDRIAALAAVGKHLEGRRGHYR